MCSRALLILAACCLAGCDCIFSFRVDVREGDRGEAKVVPVGNLDALQGRPIAGAKLETLPDRSGVPHPIGLSSEDGTMAFTFLCGPFGPGRWRLRCTKPGFEPVTGAWRVGRATPPVRTLLITMRRQDPPRQK